MTEEEISERKKEQNRAAAQRYREKMKASKQGEVEVLFLVLFLMTMKELQFVIRQHTTENKEQFAGTKNVDG